MTAARTLSLASTTHTAAVSARERPGSSTSNVFGFYAQDTWRFTDRLTLNLGLRYDAHSPWVESNNQQANYNIATGNIDLAGQNGASSGLL